MSNKCVSATKAELRQEIAELRHVGGMMSNLCFNLAQDNKQSQANRDSMDHCRRNWDAIKRRENPGRPR